MTTNEQDPSPDNPESDNGVAGEVGRTVRRSLDSWPRTLRLCAVVTTAAVLWTGAQYADHLMDVPPPPTQYSSTVPGE